MSIDLLGELFDVKDLIQLSNKGGVINLKSKIPSGIYVVVSKKLNGSHASIERAVGEDSQGILYIGSSITLAKRIRKFQNVVNNNLKRGHAGAVTYLSRPALVSKFSNQSLWIYFKPASKYLDLEDQLLQAYESKHGEFPPLNLKRAKKK